MKMNTGSKLGALALGLNLLLTGPLLAQTANQPVSFSIVQSRGVDSSVDYAALANIGPWDDRNYRLTKKEVELLSAAEADAIIAIPAFYRVEMRKANPNLPKSGPAQYPRSALQGFLAKYKGYEVNGVQHSSVNRTEAGRYEILVSRTSGDVSPNFLAGNEKRVTTPAGASESAVAINPTNSNLVIAGTNGPGSGQKMWRSADGGVTWLGPTSLANTCCDPTVAWSPNGATAYAGALSTVVGSGTNVLFYRSTDNGATWTLTKTLSTGNVSDKEYMHVDTYASSPRLGYIYMAWHENNVQKFSRSADGGTTWLAANLTIDSASRGIGSDLMSDKSGNVYFVFPTTSGGSNAKQIRVSKSTDGGASFAAAVTGANLNADFDFPIPAMESRRAFVYVSCQADTTAGTFGNRLYCAYTDTDTAENNTTASANHSVIKVIRSSDGGATWASSYGHETTNISTVDRFNQWLSVDNQGRVFVAYYDTRNSASRSGADLYYSVSTDGGVTFSAGTRLTAVTSKNIANANEWGDYNGMDMVMNDIMAIYTDNRDETGGTAESVDVYVKGGFAPAGGGNVAPTANFSFTTSGLTATFTDSSSDSDGTIASRSWNFGDSTTSTATSPSKTYAAAGTYNVTLTVTDNGGLTNTITKAVTVSTAANVAPVANFSFTTSGLTATFTDSSTDSDGTIASRSWNFGDSTTSTATSPSKTYAAAGTYNVTLTVTDNAGATNSKTSAVTVSAPSNVLTNNVAVTGIAVATAGNSVTYTMVVPAGATNLSFKTTGGTGDADMYVKFGSAPTDTVYDCRPFASGNVETCSFATPSAGTYYVRLKAYSAFTGVSLTGSYTPAGSGGGTQTYSSTTPFTINDNTTINSPITVSGRTGNASATASVSVNITHTYQGDLKVDLVAPDGTLYNLHNRTGAGTDNVIKTVTLNLSSELLNGTWNMRVQDAGAGDVGTLNSWSVTF